MRGFSKLARFRLQSFAVAAVGCATPIAILFFLIGVVCARGTDGPISEEPLAAGAMLGGVAFIAVLFLLTRDLLSQPVPETTERQQLQEKIWEREDVSDADFVAEFPGVDSRLLLETRNQVAWIIRVPRNKIHPTDSLHTDLPIDVDGPFFRVRFVQLMQGNLNQRIDPVASWGGELKNLGDLASKVQQLIAETAEREASSE